MRIQLLRSISTLTAIVDSDPITTAALTPFDLDMSQPISFIPWALDPRTLPPDWQLGVLVGASGSGKSTLLRQFGSPATPRWLPNRSIVSHFVSATDAVNRLTAVGLNSVPTWRKPYAVLSTGERWRADLARVIGNGACMDEYSATVSRQVARAASYALTRWRHAQNVRSMVLATCHRDVLEWLAPDWIVDTDAGTLTIGIDSSGPTWRQHVWPVPMATITWNWNKR